MNKKSAPKRLSEVGIKTESILADQTQLPSSSQPMTNKDDIIIENVLKNLQLNQYIDIFRREKLDTEIIVD